MKNKYQKIKFPVLKSGIMVSYDYDYADNSEAYTTLFDSKENNNPIIHFNANNIIPCNVVLHEVIHAVKNVFVVRCGIDEEIVGNKFDEFLNYYCDYSFNEIMKFCVNKKIDVSLVNI